MAGTRLALLIATGQYDNPGLRQLRSPGRDAEGLAEVLKDPDIGGFEVQSVVDGRHHEVNRAIEQFFLDRSRDDLLLLHMSCHGIKNDNGELYFAARDTDRRLLASTGVSAAFLQTQMRRCRARSIVLLLDCCYSGAFLPGSKGDTAVHVKDELAGHGRAVLTATNRAEYAWEGEHLSELEPEPSRFTGAIIEGLRTGEADGNRDGLVSVHDLYDYVYESMHSARVRQRPQMWAELEYRVVIAQAPAARQRTPKPRRLGGRYELGLVLGRGGLTEVHLALDTHLDRTVAARTLRADLAHDEPSQARFRREIQSTASLDHPAIVAVHDTGEDYGDGPYLVMEHVDGFALREILHSGRKLLPERAMQIGVGILQALEYAHRNGVVHGDVQPANVMLTRRGQVKVRDFGIARAVRDYSTMEYMSPEQAKGEHTDHRSDVYSTGCLLYGLLASRPPFVDDSPVVVAYQHVREEPQPPSHFDPEATLEMDAIVLKALAKNPNDRYQSAAEMCADINACLDGHPIAAMGPFVPYWFAVPEARSLWGDDDSGTPVAELTPGTWYLAVDRRGTAGLLAQVKDGRRGILRDTSGIQRG